MPQAGSEPEAEPDESDEFVVVPTQEPEADSSHSRIERILAASAARVEQAVAEAVSREQRSDFLRSFPLSQADCSAAAAARSSEEGSHPLTAAPAGAAAAAADTAEARPDAAADDSAAAAAREEPPSASSACADEAVREQAAAAAAEPPQASPGSEGWWCEDRWPEPLARVPVNPTSRVPITRCYSVWWIPGFPSLTGVHVGGIRAWAFLLGYIDGQRYTPSRARLRAADDVDAAVALFDREAARHGVEPVPKIYIH